jgi:hypothetical protein
MNACINQAPKHCNGLLCVSLLLPINESPLFLFLEGFQIDFICGKNGQVALACK